MIPRVLAGRWTRVYAWETATCASDEAETGVSSFRWQVLRSGLLAIEAPSKHSAGQLAVVMPDLLQLIGGHQITDDSILVSRPGVSATRATRPEPPPADPS